VLQIHRFVTARADFFAHCVEHAVRCG
jgi:hypothetical protein